MRRNNTVIVSNRQEKNTDLVLASDHEKCLIHFMNKNRIREIRKVLGLSSYKLAELAETSQPQIIRMEHKDVKLLKQGELDKIAKALGCEPGNLTDPEFDPREVLLGPKGLGAPEESPLEVLARDPLVSRTMSIFYKTWFLSEYGKLIPIEELPPLVYSLYGRIKLDKKPPNDEEIKRRVIDILSGMAASRRR